MSYDTDADTDRRHVLSVVSLGAGVQSSALLLLVLDGKLHADCAIFADTQWEPAAVYAQLSWLRERCDAAGFPVHVVTRGSIRDDALQPGAFVSMPIFGRTAAGTITREHQTMGQRQCTNQYKLRPIRSKIRELIGGSTAGVRVDVLQGITTDEAERMTTNTPKYLRNVYPFVDMGWSRDDCERYLLDEHGVVAPKSACVGCPYRSNDQWLALTDAEREDAYEFDERLRDQRPGYELFVHRSLVPLRRVDFTRTAGENRLLDAGQGSLFGNDCYGICGV